MEIKWIKMSTDLFNNRKIKQIERMQDGDAIIVIWLKLLVLAAEINDGGDVYFLKSVPFSEESLAVEFGRSVEIIALALRTFEAYGMIEIKDHAITIINWERYQNIEGMEKAKEQNRKRQQAWRDRQKEKKVAEESTVTLHNALDKNRLDIKEKDIPKGISKKKSSQKHKYGRYDNVLLSDEELQKLKAEFPSDWEERIERVSEYVASKGKPYKDYLATIRSWARRDSKGVGSHGGIGRNDAAQGEFAEFNKFV